MRLSQGYKPHNSGFTLIEMLVVAPIAILAVATIVSFSISIMGDAMIAQARATTAYDTQDALDRIEQDVRVSSAFLSNFNITQAGQGKNATAGGATANDTTAFVGGASTLVLNQTATTKSPYTANRDLVYYANQPNACAAANKTLNRTLTVRVIYFIRTDSGVATLWRRTIVPDWNTNSTVNIATVCDSPWQRDNCPSTSIAGCQAVDEKLLDNVSMEVVYYTAAGVITSDPKTAQNLKVTLTSNQTVAGSTLTHAGSLRASRINETLDVAPTTAPVISVYNPTVNADNNPKQATFQWTPVAYAGTYRVRYQVNGGPWTTLTTTATKQVVPADPLDVINIGVIGSNDMGDSPEGTLNYATPLWTPANLVNGWTSWGTETSTGHTQAAYTITKGGAVIIKGMMQKATTVANEEIMFTLPPGLRPTARLIYGVKAGSLAGVGRLDIDSSGNVMLLNVTDASSWVTLDGIMFVASGTQPWTTVSPNSGYNLFYSPYSTTIGYFTDPYSGRISVQGMLSGNASSVSSSFPSIGTAPSHVRTIGANTAETVYGINQNGGTVSGRTNSSGGLPTSWHSLIYTYYPNQGSGWTSFTPQNGWNYLGSGWETPGYRKGADGVVSLKGLMNKSSASNGEVIFTLPAGFRPRQTWFVVPYTGCNSAGLIYIKPTGAVEAYSTTLSSGCTSLDNIHFMAEQ